MDTSLQRVALASNAIYIPAAETDTTAIAATPAAMAFTATMLSYGYELDQRLYNAVCHLGEEELGQILDVVGEERLTKYNWMPLTRNWTVPTGATYFDALVAILANCLPEDKRMEGDTLPCGHFIPKGTFPLDRYNGCPLCGKPFATTDWTYTGGGVPKRLLALWDESDLVRMRDSLLRVNNPLEGTQMAQLKSLLASLGLPENPGIKIREIAAMAFVVLADSGHEEQAKSLISTPTDLLRALWYEKTLTTRISRPKTIIDLDAKTVGYKWQDDYCHRVADMRDKAAKRLKLKYNRKRCRLAADILEGMAMSVESMCENMNPHRGMWVRVIRALRLTEYARKARYECLAELLDRFYRGDYRVWRGEVERALISGRSEQALALLKERPGAFSRCLFATMLKLGTAQTLEAFGEVAGKLDRRLLLSLDMYVSYCLNPEVERTVRMAEGGVFLLNPNPHLQELSSGQLADMIAAVKACCGDALRQSFAAQGAGGQRVYINESLFSIPLPVGERSRTDAGADYIPQGTRFAVEGNNVRLFLHWGRGLPSQHMDLDLSAVIAYPNRREDCAYFNLTATGAQHSGDIQMIPDKVGAAEYIELDLAELREAGAEFVVFMFSVYTDGGIDASAVAGWMDSKYPMKVDKMTGVAYDPSTVQFMARVHSGGQYSDMVFGVLDVAAGEIIWLDMPDDGQTSESLHITTVRALMVKLENRMSIGEYLAIRAEATGQERVDTPEEADEVFLNNKHGFDAVLALL